MGKFTITVRRGDTGMAWAPTDAESTRRAAEEFERLRVKNYYLVARDRGEKETDRPIAKFDPNVDEIIAVPAIAGGGGERA